MFKASIRCPVSSIVNPAPEYVGGRIDRYIQITRLVLLLYSQSCKTIGAVDLCWVRKSMGTRIVVCIAVTKRKRRQARRKATGEYLFKCLAIAVHEPELRGSPSKCLQVQASLTGGPDGAMGDYWSLFAVVNLDVCLLLRCGATLWKLDLDSDVEAYCFWRTLECITGAETMSLNSR